MGKRTAGKRHGGSAPSKLRRHDHYTGGGRTLDAGHAAAVEGRTIFPTTRVYVEETIRILKTGDNQRKLGKYVTKGKWRGFPIYTLTLEERATCPATCAHWLSCYGNNMHFAQRFVADSDFEEILWLEIEGLNRKFPRGFVVRLHILGDFYSVGYVRLWERALDAFPALHVFGYTARCPDTDPIGRALHPIIGARWDRFAIRYSGVDEPTGAAVTIEKGAATPHIACPAQTGKTECCGTCALCWTSPRTIAFQRH